MNLLIVIYGLKIEISIAYFSNAYNLSAAVPFKELELAILLCFLNFFFKICSEFVPFNKAVWRHCDLTGPETVFGRTRKIPFCLPSDFPLRISFSPEIQPDQLDHTRWFTQWFTQWFATESRIFSIEHYPVYRAI